MKIKELGQKTGLTAPTIRFYEQKGLLDERHVRRKENNYREYSMEAVEHLQMIKNLQSAGFTLVEIQVVAQDRSENNLPLSKKIEFIHQKLKEIDHKKADLERIQMHLKKMLSNKLALMAAEGEKQH